jgi:hypothetical protein
VIQIIGWAALIGGVAGMAWICGFRSGLAEGLELGQIDADSRGRRRLRELLADPELYQEARVEALAGGRL